MPIPPIGPSNVNQYPAVPSPLQGVSAFTPFLLSQLAEIAQLLAQK